MPFPSPGDLPHPGIEPRSPALQADTLPSEPKGIAKVSVYIYTHTCIPMYRTKEWYHQNAAVYAKDDGGGVV